MSKAHTSGAQIGGCVGNGRAAAPGAADWLCLAAAPTFAAMALLTWASGGDADMMEPCVIELTSAHQVADGSAIGSSSACVKRIFSATLLIVSKCSDTRFTSQ
jgi:hypothetical protein